MTLESVWLSDLSRTVFVSKAPHVLLEHMQVRSAHLSNTRH